MYTVEAAIALWYTFKVCKACTKDLLTLKMSNGKRGLLDEVL